MRIRGLVLGLVALAAVPAAAQAKPPALTVSKLSHPATVKAGSPLAVKVSVRNPAARKAKAARLTLLLSRDRKRDKRDVKLKGAVKVKPLGARKRATAKGRVTVPAATQAGSYKLLACAGKRCRAGRTIKVTRGGGSGTGGGTAPPPPARPTPGNENIPPGPVGPVKPGNPPPQPDPVPADPTDVAPTLDPGASTSVADATRFLYTGANPIQRGVAAGAIEPEQVAVLRGKVVDRVGAPIKGVRVTVLDHPELGMTNTRADGAFDLAVNGGGLTLEFEVAGFLPVQRTLAPDWQDYETLGDVVMVPVDPNVETVDPDSTAAFQVVQGTESEDEDGERQGTLMFAKGTEGEMELPNGQVKPLDEMKVRVTEFTYGSQGDEAMPGDLPATTGYTYAAEFSVDEALKAGATEVRFDKPVINYTENFIGAPVGSPVPTGYYDREQAEWVPSENGRVIEVVSETGGVAGVDVDGDGAAEPAGSPKLAALDITDAEQRRLAALYDPGQELWRVLITHFTPWDHNWPYGPPPGARPPKLKEFEWKDPNDPCRQKGSEIGCETQTLGEALPLAGTDMTINYSSDRTPGWKVDETLDIPIVGSTVPERLKGVQLLIDVAGERIEKRWCDPNYATTGASTCKDLPLIEPNTSFAFRWDGLDAYDRRVQGRLTATIRVLYVYEFNYYESSTDFSSSFSQFGSDSEVFDGRFNCGNRAGNMDSHFFCGIPIGQTITRAIGSWDARPTHGLGGWSLNEHHAYDPVEKALHRGDGAVVRSEAMPPAVERLAGTYGRGVGGGPGAENFPKDGEVARDANIDYLGDYVRSPDGNLYLHNGLNRNHIFRVGRDGKIALFAGNGSKAREITGEGGPAKNAALGVVSALAAEPDGSLLVASYTGDMHAQVIRRFSPDGSRVTTIAGSLDRLAPLGDGKPALEAHIGSINDLVVAPDGSIYWTERYSQINGWKGRVRRIGQDGIVSTVGRRGRPRERERQPGRPGRPGRRPIRSRDRPGRLDLRRPAVPQEGHPDRRRRARDAVRRQGRRRRARRDRVRRPGRAVVHRRATDAGGRPGRLGLHPHDGLRRLALELGDPARARRRGARARRRPPARHLRLRRAGRRARRERLHAEPLDHDRRRRRQRAHVRRRPLPDPQGDGAAAGLRPRGPRAAVRRRLGGVRVRPPRPPPAHARRHHRCGDPHVRVRRRQAADRRRGRIRQPHAGRARRGRQGDGGQSPRRAAHGAGDRRRGLARGHHQPGVGDRPARLPRGRGPARLLPPARGRHDPLRLRRPGPADPPPRRRRRRAHADAQRARGRHARDDRDGRRAQDELLDGSAPQRRPAADRARAERRRDRLGGQDGRPHDRHRARRHDRDGRDRHRPALGLARAGRGRHADRDAGRQDAAHDPRGPCVARRPDRPFSATEIRSTFREGSETSTWTYAAGSATNLDDQTVTARTAEGRETVTTLDRHGRVTKQTAGTGVPLEYAYDERGRLKSAKQGPQVTTFTYDARHRVLTRGDASGAQIRFGYDDADRVIERVLPGGEAYRYEYDDDGNISKLTTPRGKVHTFGSTAGDRPASSRRPAARLPARVFDRAPARERHAPRAAPCRTSPTTRPGA